MEILGITGTEWIGYAASLAVLISFTMKDLKKLRTINALGSLLFILYGFLMPTLRVGLPIIITNLAIFAINLYHLTRKPA